MYTGAYIVVLAFGSLPADYFGRKACLFACQFFLAIGCLNELLAKDWTHWMISKIWPVSLTDACVVRLADAVLGYRDRS
jgi:hypothetical protein